MNINHSILFFKPYYNIYSWKISIYSLLQGVLQVEQKLGGKLLDRPKSMPFQDGGANLCLCLEDVAQGWRCKPGANYQVSVFNKTRILYFSSEVSKKLLHLSLKIILFTKM